MPQTFDVLNASDLLSDSRNTINNAFAAVASSFSGTAFPTTNLYVGMLCYRTDLSELYVLYTGSPVQWVRIAKASQTYLSQETADGRYAQLGVDNTLTGNTTIASARPTIIYSQTGGQLWETYTGTDGGQSSFFIDEKISGVFSHAIEIFAGSGGAGGAGAFLNFYGNKIWTAGNDGAGSGLNADLLDGQDSSYYLNASNIGSGALSIAHGGTGSGTAAGARTALGLGNSATYNIGTSGSNVPLLNGVNVWAAGQTVLDTASGSISNSLYLRNNVGGTLNTGVAIIFDPNGNGAARAAMIRSYQDTAGNFANLDFYVSPSDTPRLAFRINSDASFNWAGNSFNTLTIQRGGSSITTYVANATNSALTFQYSGVTVGSITCSSSATAFNTSSDYRLKENVIPLTGALERIANLKPSRFNFISNPGTVVDGFLAHEVTPVVPEAITGEKDEMQDIGDVKTADGKIVRSDVVEPHADELMDGQTWTKTGSAPKYQSIDQSKLVPLNTAGIQELKVLVDALTARVAALEAA